MRQSSPPACGSPPPPPDRYFSDPAAFGHGRVDPLIKRMLELNAPLGPQPPAHGPTRARGLSLRSQIFASRLSRMETTPTVVTQGKTSGKTPLVTFGETTVEILEEPHVELHSLRESSLTGNQPSEANAKPRAWRTLKNKLLGRTELPPSRDGRHIPMGADPLTLIDERTGKAYCNNTVTSSRYTMASFLPRQLYAQFLKFANTYFLIVAILQMIPKWSTTGQYTTIIPLLIFVSISMGREAYDDYRRHALDRKENMRRVLVQLDPSANAGHSPRWVFWKDLQVGQVVHLGDGDWVPADIVLLSTSQALVLVETMALDGETNLKARTPPPELPPPGHGTTIITEDPNMDLYNFEGRVTAAGPSTPLGPENVLYRGSIVRHSEAVGLVVFTGEETKIRMNAIRNPRVKAPKLQAVINRIVLFMAMIVVCLLALFTMAERLQLRTTTGRSWYLEDMDVGVAAILMGYIIMFNTLIPLSLYVTTEIIKVMQGLLMAWDIDMFHKESNTPAQTQTATILEELGQVSYIFTDKTGTLTNNEMVFKKMCVGGVAFASEVLDPDCDTPVQTPPFGPPYPDTAALDPTLNTAALLHHLHTTATPLSTAAGFFLLTLALCHECLPKGDSYLASSPDELALVLAARAMGYIVYERNHKQLTIKTTEVGVEVVSVYEILDVVPFSSARKRMSVVVRFPDGRICLVCKGADSVVWERLEAPEAHEALVTRAVASQRKRDVAAALLVRQASMEVRRSRDREPRARGSLEARVRASMDVEEMVRASIDSGDGRLSFDTLNGRSLGRHSLAARPGSAAFPEMPALPTVLRQTLGHIDAFANEGLRTLVYGCRWIEEPEYAAWAARYSRARVAHTDRAAQVEAVGASIEHSLRLVGVTAIEDKLQTGVPEAIEKLRRAGIKMWMLTGDKRETAVTIGHACRLIRDHSTVVTLADAEGAAAKIAATAASLGSMAHCVVVVDGATLAELDTQTTLELVSLCCRVDAVVICRASPAQKAAMVLAVRADQPGRVTLAVGDGANDIAMIQSADVGVGITGHEGLQAARSSDYSIAQFRFLLKLLLVHGRYNYVRTSRFVLCTFYKELLFYLSQAAYQRYTCYTGLSLYESWSLSMFNTLFTSLCVVCVGMFEKDLKPATLLAVPELYRATRTAEGFSLGVFLGWMVLAAGQSMLLTFLSFTGWGFSALSDNSVFPMGMLTFTVLVVVINVKCQLVEMHNRTAYAFGSLVISIGGWFLWNLIIAGLYRTKASPIYFVEHGFIRHFGRDITWWAALLVLTVATVMMDVVIKAIFVTVRPTETQIFQLMEKRSEARRFFEETAYLEMRQGWEWQRDKSTAVKLRERIFGRPTPEPQWYHRKRAGTASLEPSVDESVLPSGKPNRSRSNSMLVRVRQAFDQPQSLE